MLCWSSASAFQRSDSPELLDGSARVAASSKYGDPPAHTFVHSVT
ncbi:hypothetical protein [Nonomuraea sp. 10N515B]